MKRGTFNVSAMVLCVSLAISASPALAASLSDAVRAYSNADYATALPIFRELARKGDAEAQFWLGSMYMLGEGAPADSAKGIRLIRAAADAGVARAQFLMGDMYERGLGVSADLVEAMTWFKIAASRVHVDQDNAVSGEADMRAFALEPRMNQNEVDQARAQASKWEPVRVEPLDEP